jgi:hypothetical protein
LASHYRPDPPLIKAGPLSQFTPGDGAAGAEFFDSTHNVESKSCA